MTLDLLGCLHFRANNFLFFLVRVDFGSRRWASLEFGEFPKKDSKQSRTRGQLVAI
jgi:hypothetical protein